jgi:hypothetical protein
MPRLCELYPGICLTTEENAREILNEYSRRVPDGTLIAGKFGINPLKAELNPICHLLALLGAHHILHVSRERVKLRLGINFTVSVQLLKVFIHFIHTCIKFFFHTITFQMGARWRSG